MSVGLKDAFDTVEGARNLPFPDAVDPSNFVLSKGQGKYVAFLQHCLGRGDTLKSLANGAFTKLAWDYPQLLPEQFNSSTPARVYSDLFLDWEAERDGPWAACVNFMDGHLPYLPEAEYDRWGGSTLRDLQDEMDDQVWEFNGGQRPWWQRKALEGLYDGTIRQMDTEIKRVLGALEHRGVLDETLVVITSDHGEGFGEPSFVRPGARISGHGQGIHEVLLHVPLVVKAPGQKREQTVNDVATLTAFPDAVRSMLDGESPGFVPRKPVVASSDGLEKPMEKRSQAYCEDISRFDGEAKAVYGGSGTEVIKHELWRDQSASIRVRDSKVQYRVDGDASACVEERFGSIQDAGVQNEGSPIEEVGEATKNRLENLGYI
jgi:arylsulfatase A-like enzyme